jgi:hypothetical protein
VEFMIADSSRHVAWIDVTGEYLLVDMTSDVFMILGKQISEILVSLDPSYSPFINQNIVKLDKALNGCVEKARLWFNEVTSRGKRI